MIKAILFDLDGTLLPMNQEDFTNSYFHLLSKTMEKYGYSPEYMVKAVWTGTGAMVKNDGSTTNEEVFWREFSKFFDRDVRADEPLFNAFYENEFQNVKKYCGYNENAKKLVDEARSMGYRVILATNPLFPAIATESRIRWAGLVPEDFELYTTYEDIGYCKPNLKYYQEILKRIDLLPKECMMIGNDVSEDMVAEQLGMKVFLLTDCLINKENTDISFYPNGSFKEALEYIKCQ